MRRRWIDRVLVGAAVLLVAGVAVDSLVSGRGGERGQTPTATRSTHRPQRVVDLQQNLSFSGSALATELGTCSFLRLSIEVRPGPVLAVHNLGSGCRLPELDLDAAVRDIHGQFVHRVRALLDGALPTTIAGGATVLAPLAPGLLRCWSGRPLGLRATDQGKVVAGTIRCRVQR